MRLADGGAARRRARGWMSCSCGLPLPRAARCPVHGRCAERVGEEARNGAATLRHRSCSVEWCGSRLARQGPRPPAGRCASGRQRVGEPLACASPRRTPGRRQPRSCT